MQKMKKRIGIMFSLIIILASINMVIFGENILPSFAVVESNSNNVSTYKTAESSLKTSEETPIFDFKSASQILMEASTGKVIYANNENERLLPASVTKIMTLLLLMERIDRGEIAYTDTITCSALASKMGGSQIWFKEGETLTIDEALKCICVVSANDVSYAVGELIGGTCENFVKMMNEKARELGMNNTNFMNPHGIDEEGHYTTALDIALMSRELITKHPDIIKYTTIWMDTIRNGEFGLSNTNKLIKTYKGITGLKTGSTSQALFNLSATATRDDLSLISVVLKAPSSEERSQEITALLNYGFSTYTSKKLASAKDLVNNIYINKNIMNKVNIIYEQDEYLISKKGENKEYNVEYEIDSNVTAPIDKGLIVGRAKFLDKEGNILRETNLVSEKNIARSNLWDYMKYFAKIFVIRGLKSNA